MSLSILSRGRSLVRPTTLAISALVIGLVVGVGCVLLPPAIPLGLVGLLGAFLVWVMPEIRVVPSRLGRLALYPFAFSLVAIPTYYALVLPGMPWISIRRILLFTCVGTTLITLGGSAFYRRKLLTRMKEWKWFFIPLIGFLLVQLLASLQSIEPSSSMSDLINTITSQYIPLVAIVIFIDHYKQIERIIIVILSGSLIALILGAIEYHVQHAYLFMALPSWVATEIANENPMAPMSGLMVMRDGGYRASSIFMVPLSWAEMAMMLAPFTLHLVISGTRVSIRALGAFMMVAIIASLFFAGSRGGYVGFIVGCLFYLAIYFSRLVLDNPSSMAGPIFGFVFSLGALGVVGAVFFVGRVNKAILGSGTRLTSDAARHEQWMLALPKFLSRPILGYGPATANGVVGYVTPNGNATLDSYFINVMIGTGTVGLFVYAMIFVALLLSVLNLRRPRSPHLFSLKAGLTGSVFGYLVYRATLNQTENNTLLFIEFGLLTVLHMLSRAEDSRIAEPRRPEMPQQMIYDV